MKKILIAIFLLLVLVVVLLLVVRSASPNPVAIIKVVDKTGKPIAGALITPDGLRPKLINGHWGWGLDNLVPATPVKTDSQGIARVPYPRYVFEKTETGEISFGVSHPDFCSDRPFRVVSATPPANASWKNRATFIFMLATRRIVTRPEPVVLLRGGIVKVSGFMGAKENIIPHAYAQLASIPVPRPSYWERGDAGTLLNRRVHEGTNAVRLIYLPPTGRACFSEPASFRSVSGQTNEFFLELKPGTQLNGRLDDTVPRPVLHGQVQVSVSSDAVNTNNNKVSWRAWQEINVDGTFSFASLPTGNAEVAVLCDGFKSRDGSRKIASFCAPQSFPLTNQDTNVVITMERTATAEITILDDQGQPLPDADAGFSPNVIWNGQGSSIFMGWSYNSEEVFRSEAEFDWRKISKGWPPVFSAKSDKHGIAMVSNLPAFKQRFYVGHTNYDLPINPDNNARNATTDLLPGETNRVTVRMVKKGAQFLESPR